MNVFRRPMFRGGPVDSRGTGITSGLSYNKGGRVGYHPGGFVPSYKFSETPIARGIGALTNEFNKALAGIYDLGAVPINTLGRMFGYNPGFSGTKFMDTITGGDFLRNNPNLDPNIAYFGLETSAKPGFTLPSMQPPKVEEEPKKDPPPKKDPLPGTGKGGNEETSTDIKDAIREDKELFAELLGAKKARGQDIADMLLSFSSKALAPEATVKSAFADFAADEVKRPSRVSKVGDSAAALAINAYIAGEKSKADLERALKATEGKLDLEQDLLKSRSLTSRINNDRTGRTVKQIVVGNTKEWMSDNNISGVPNLVSKKDIEDPKLLVQENVGEVFINEDTKEVFLMIQDANGNISLKQYY